MSIYTSFLDTTIRESSSIALSFFGKTTSSTKPGDNNQVLTEADLAIGKHIIERIQRSFPDHNIIDEEAGVIDKQSEFTWVIDPIDGTSNFAQGVPTYGVMVGLLQNDAPVAGAIALPSFQQVCIAEKGTGAWFENQRIHVSTEKNLLSSLIAYQIDGHQENPDITKQECAILSGIVLGCRNVRSSGSCFDWIMVAKGSFGGVLNRTSKIWDNVANQILIEEAGGMYTDFFGRQMNYHDALKRTNQNFTTCAAAPILHEQLQAIIHK